MRRIKSLRFQNFGLIVLLISINYFKTFNQKIDNILFIEKVDNKPLRAISFSNDNKYILFGGDSKRLYLYDTKSFKSIKKYEDFLYPVNAIKFVNENQFFIAIGPNLYLKDINDNTLASYRGYTTFIWSFDYNFPANTIIAGSFGPKVIVWELNSGREKYNLKEHKESVLAVAISPDGSKLITGSLDKYICLWSKEGKFIEKKQIHNDNIMSIIFHPSGKYFVSASLDKTIRLCSVDSFKIIKTILTEGEYVTKITLSNDGNHIFGALANGDIYMWHLFSGNLLFIFSGLKGVVNDIALNKDNTLLAGVSKEGYVAIWNINKIAYVINLFKQKIEEETGNIDFINEISKNKKIDINSKFIEIIDKYYEKYQDTLKKYEFLFLRN